MTQKCQERLTASAVEMSCFTTKCSLTRGDKAHHITRIANFRSGSIYQVEICSVSWTGLVDFNGGTKSITRYGIVASGSMEATTSVELSPLAGPGTEQILTTIEFYDATQRVGNNTFLGAKESYQIDYELDLL